MAPISKAISKKFSNMKEQVKMLEKKLEEQATNMQMEKEIKKGGSCS